MTNPYRGLDPLRFWSSAMTSPPPGQIDPVTRSVTIANDEPVATMGSCFAQHLSRHMRASGLHYYVAEDAPEGMAADAAATLGYGVFSARYGNVYTVRQAVQLFDRAYGRFRPKEVVWERDGRFYDPFRPQVQPGGYATAAEVRAAAAEHLARVRDVFQNARWLVFTLGLTEGWRSREDGAVYPVAPGVAAGSFDAAQHEFVNFTAAEVSADLDAFVQRLGSVNPQLGVILTVSPVPLIATYEARHVLVSTSFSKAALRVAADEAERRHANVVYFPSYEIITSPASNGRYYQDDLRQVTDLGVSHVMRMFEKHFFASPRSYLRQSAQAAAGQPPAPQGQVLVCDEEVIVQSLQAQQR